MKSVILFYIFYKKNHLKLKANRNILVFGFSIVVAILAVGHARCGMFQFFAVKREPQI